MRKKQFNRDGVCIGTAFHLSAQKLQAAQLYIRGVCGSKVSGLRFNAFSLMWTKDSSWAELSKDNTQERDQIHILCPKAELGEK